MMAEISKLNTSLAKWVDKASPDDRVIAFTGYRFDADRPSEALQKEIDALRMAGRITTAIRRRDDDLKAFDVIAIRLTDAKQRAAR